MESLISFRGRILLILFLLVGPMHVFGQDEQTASSSNVLATIDGEPVTQGELDLYLKTRAVPPDQQRSHQRVFLDQLIDQQLVKRFLDRNKVKTPKDGLKWREQQLTNLMIRRGLDPETFLEDLGIDEATWNQQLRLPLRWQAYLQRVLTPTVVREYFEQNKSHFDGTQIRASQIFFKLPKDRSESEIKEAIDRMEEIRAEIATSKITFEAAAKKYSQSPSATKGGNLGYFPFRGKMPASLTEPIFDLPVNHLSDPIVTTFGLHVLVVTDRKPGMLSLEDARPRVYHSLSQREWKQTVKAERDEADIEYTAAE